MKLLAKYCLMFCLVSKANAQFDKVRIAIENNDLKKAEILLDSVSQLRKHTDSVFYYSALMALKGDNLKEARKSAERLQIEFPDFRIHYLNGLIGFVNKDFAGSIDEFGKALNQDPKNVKALYNRALALGLLEDFDTAMEDLNTCLNIHPGFLPALYSRAYWSELSGKLEQAETDYKQVINLDKRNYDAYMGLAHVYQLQNDPVKACEVINAAIAEGSQIAEELKASYCK